VERLASLYEVSPESILVGRGSDEAIDLLVRGFCRAGQDSVVICPPTFGMYSVAARIQGADVLTVPLRADAGFALDEQAVLDQCKRNVKLVFPLLPQQSHREPAERRLGARPDTRAGSRAVVVVDEAYIEFSSAQSLARRITEFPHLAILRTLSKAYALAGARCGTLIADPEVISLLRKVIPPYAIAQLSMEAVLKALEPAQISVSNERLHTIQSERQRLLAALPTCSNITRVCQVRPNFVLAEFADAPLALARSAERAC